MEYNGRGTVITDTVAGEEEVQMQIQFKAIGFVRSNTSAVPRHWSVSDVEGEIRIDEEYVKGLQDIHKGQDILVFFYFHQSQEFAESHLIQKPPHRNERLGVFSTCSPVRPNPLGMSVLKVIEREGHILRVKGLDMIDRTPILDIKPLTGLRRDTIV